MTADLFAGQGDIVEGLEGIITCLRESGEEYIKCHEAVDAGFDPKYARQSFFDTVKRENMGWVRDFMVGGREYRSKYVANLSKAKGAMRSEIYGAAINPSSNSGASLAVGRRVIANIRRIGSQPMSHSGKESIANVVHEGIKRGIQILLENKCYGSAVVLIYAGIDAMAFLSMPACQQDVTRQDFIAWVDRYFEFPCKKQLTGLDLYGARCSMLHNYSVTSRLSRDGACRMIGYMDKSTPEVVHDPKVDRGLVMVSVTGLAEAFFRGVDRFIIDVFGDPVKAPLARERLRTLVHRFPYGSRSDVRRRKVEDQHGRPVG